MRRRASAPAKLVLAGEYAVRHGAPALVLAVDRRVVVDVAPAATWSLATDLPGGTAEGDPRGHALVAEALEASLGMDWATQPAHRIHIASEALRDGPDGVPLGLGSSAAVATALLAALAGTTPAVDQAISLHRTWQGGVGSGIDVAAACLGGCVSFQMRTGGDGPKAARVSGESVHPWRAFFTGTKASTRMLLAGVDALRERDPGAHDAAMDEIAHAAQDLAAAWPTRDTDALLAAVRAHHRGMDRLGQAAGVDIVSPPHQTLAALAEELGAAYKPSGAGGGDVGIAFARDPAILSALAARARTEGLVALDLSIDPQGATVDELSETSHL